jgi:outer membrane protein OmpA-like peptidoglycan-associated protein
MDKSWIRGALAWGVAALVWGTCAEALADDPIASTNGKGMDTHLFRPAMDSKGLFSINGTEILGANDISFGLILDYGETLLRVIPSAGAPGPSLPNASGVAPNQLINDSFQGTFQFNYGIKNLVVVGLDLPVILMTGNAEENAAGNPVVDGWGTGQLNAQNLEFIGIHGKLRILRVERGFGIAVGLQMGVPVTDAPRQAGAEPGFFVWPQLMLEKRLGSRGQLKIDLNAGYRAHGSSSTTIGLRNGDYVDGNLFTYGGGAAYRLFPSVDLVAETYGTYLVSSAASTGVKASNEVVGGLKLFVERNSYFMLGAGPRYTPGFEAADVRAFLGFVYEPSIGDRDGDGIKDDVDKCPDEPEDFDGFQDADGCPDPDNDNDGIPDVNDRCINEPEDRDGDQDADGCPEGNNGDRDGDGILDVNDKCPDEPEDRDGFQDKDGCPDPDNDKDGIPDKQDACPNDPEDFDGFQDKDGCPDPDNDKDGIPDVVDKCPNEPETFNGYQDEDGCPDKGRVIIQENNIIILEKIKFKTDSAEILPESDKILDEVATTINHHPEFVLMEVAGHADERGDDFYNLRLTQNRVNSVMAALIERGVDKSRLRSKGYGEYCPEDLGHNDAAWEKNRRVEFKIVKTKDGPTGVELGCPNAASHGVRPSPVP